MISRRLRLFLKVAETGSFSKAAGELYITPSAIVQQMNAMEADLECRLLVRTNKGVRLTEAGKLVREKGIQYKEECEKLYSELQIMEKPKNTIRLGSHLLYKGNCIKQIWPEFHDKHPDINLEITYYSFYEKNLMEHEILEGINIVNEPVEGWNYMEIGTIPLAVLVSRNHPLAKNKRVSLQELKPYKLVSINQKEVKSDAVTRFNKDAADEGISVEEVVYYDQPMFDRCEIEQLVLQIPLCWAELAPQMTAIPVVGDYMMSYGFMYSDNSSEATKSLLRYIKDEQPAFDLLSHGRTK